MGSLVGRRASGDDAGEVERRLASGQGASEVASACGLGPSGLVAALGWLALGGEDSEGPRLVQSRPARPRLADALGPDSLGGLFPGASRIARLGLAAGLLQAHDFWDASHAAAQEADDLGDRGLSAWWHGIAHRREPDPSNAAYWFRRVGRHPVFAELAEAAGPIVEAEGAPTWARRLLRDGGWDPFAFLDACRGREGDRLARRLQRLEMDRLLDASLRACGA
jgi:hypothetical protein